MTPAFWQGKRVFITGHTGFKGSWLVALLSQYGAEVSGYALEPVTTPNMFTLLDLSSQLTHHTIGNVQDLTALTQAMQQAQPDIVIHMAAQPLVRYSYQEPVETYATNVMGTVHVMEAFRQVDSAKICINVTTDKVYENPENNIAFIEGSPLGGYDPYSSSKACSELVTAAYRQSFMRPQAYEQHSKAVASARAGNVIGGGDWSADRLVPDLIGNFIAKASTSIRNPQAIRPWQHVLEPLSGYLQLAEKLWHEPKHYANAWNFGPEEADCIAVERLADGLVQRWGQGAQWHTNTNDHVHEAHYLKLDITKAKTELDWQPRWSLDQALDRVVQWYQTWHQGEDLQAIVRQQIADYIETSEK